MAGDSTSLSHLIKFWPIVAALVAAIGTAYVGHFRIEANAAEVQELKSTIKEEVKELQREQKAATDALNAVKESQIRQEAKTDLGIQGVKRDVDDLSRKIDLLIQLQRQNSSN